VYSLASTVAHTESWLIPDRADDLVGLAYLRPGRRLGIGGAYDHRREHWCAALKLPAGNGASCRTRPGLDGAARLGGATLLFYVAHPKLCANAIQFDEQVAVQANR
jgi:hypothetical protein